MTILTADIDLAKNVFAVHGVNEAGKPDLLRPLVPRDKLTELIAALPLCVIGMEACSGAHHWARQFQALGHTVRLIAPKFVTPYRMSGKRGKNDAADAAWARRVRRPPRCLEEDLNAALEAPTHPCDTSLSRHQIAYLPSPEKYPPRAICRGPHKHPSRSSPGLSNNQLDRGCARSSLIR